jgi:hypothetical protein
MTVFRGLVACCHNGVVKTNALRTCVQKQLMKEGNNQNNAKPLENLASPSSGPDHKPAA